MTPKKSSLVFPVIMLLPLFGCFPSSKPDVSSATSFFSTGGKTEYVKSWSDELICANATTDTGTWDYSAAFKKYVSEAQKRGLDCSKIIKRQNNVIAEAVSSKAVAPTSKSIVKSSSNSSVNQVVTSISTSEAKKLQLSDDEGITLVMASVFHSKPDKVHLYGKDAGYMANCEGVSNSKAKLVRKNLINWLKLGSTEFELLDGRKGFLNQRKFNKLLEIFQDGERQGKRDGRLMRSNAKRDFRQICEMLLADELLDGPSKRLMTLVRE